jgi:hypothetical protein
MPRIKYSVLLLLRFELRMTNFFSCDILILLKRTEVDR